MEDKKYQICVAEIDLTDGHEIWPHSFLVMADDCPHEEIKNRIFQQIHFDPDDQGILSSRFDNTLPDECKPYARFHTITVDSRENIFALWNKMQDFAMRLSDASIPFGPNFRFEPTSTNCRTGVRDTLQSVGLTLKIEFTASAAGLQAQPLLQAPEPMSCEALKPAELSF